MWKALNKRFNTMKSLTTNCTNSKMQNAVHFVEGTDERVSPSDSEKSDTSVDTTLSDESAEMDGDEIVLNLNVDFNGEATWADV